MKIFSKHMALSALLVAFLVSCVASSYLGKSSAAKDDAFLTSVKEGASILALLLKLNRKSFTICPLCKQDWNKVMLPNWWTDLKWPAWILKFCIFLHSKTYFFESYNWWCLTGEFNGLSDSSKRMLLQTDTTSRGKGLHCTIILGTG